MNSAAPTNHLLSLDEAARRCGVSVTTMRRRIRDGQIPAVRLGPSDRHPLRIDPGELRAWLYHEGDDAA